MNQWEAAKAGAKVARLLRDRRADFTDVSVSDFTDAATFDDLNMISHDAITERFFRRIVDDANPHFDGDLSGDPSRAHGFKTAKVDLRTARDAVHAIRRHGYGEEDVSGHWVDEAVGGAGWFMHSDVRDEFVDSLEARGDVLDDLTHFEGYEIHTDEAFPEDTALLVDYEVVTTAGRVLYPKGVAVIAITGGDA